MVKGSKRTTTSRLKAKAAPKVQSRNQRIKAIAIWTAVILFVFNLATGIISYGVMTVWCFRPPVVATKFAASYHYFRPGQTGYGPHAFAQYYCTEHDAQNAGFNPSSW